MDSVIPFSIYSDIAKYVIKQMQAGIKKQIGVNKQPFKPLKASTVKQKIGKGAKFATSRMYDTGFFSKNAYAYKLKPYLITIFLKDTLHPKGNATYAEIGAYNNDDRSQHFGFPADAERRIFGRNGIVDKAIDKSLDNIYG